MANLGRKPVYQSNDEKPVLVSLRIPRDVYEQVERYVKMRPRMTLTEFILDGIRLRLETPADPRDFILSDDNTVRQEVQEMIRAQVQAEIGKLNTFMGSAADALKLSPTPEAAAPQPTVQPAIPLALEPAPKTAQPDPVPQVAETPEPAPEAAAAPVAALSYDGNTVLQEKGSQPRGRRGEMRQRILELLREYPEGLSAEELRVYLKPQKPLGDTLQGMVRQHLLKKQGSGQAVRYLAAEA